MLELRLSELAQSLGVECESGSAVVSGLCFDCRVVKPGALFVAIVGVHVDGHDFIDKALGNG
ncbi:MAG: Mur ligase domain-containing protein, partial [Pseudomonadota bacterium]|nr:Mur ligase domain-containing protein [Pseudomonadota bacterium]